MNGIYDKFPMYNIRTLSKNLFVAKYRYFQQKDYWHHRMSSTSGFAARAKGLRLAGNLHRSINIETAFWTFQQPFHKARWRKKSALRTACRSEMELDSQWEKRFSKRAMKRELTINVRKAPFLIAENAMVHPLLLHAHCRDTGRSRQYHHSGSTADDHWQSRKDFKIPLHQCHILTEAFGLVPIMIKNQIRIHISNSQTWTERNFWCPSTAKKYCW